MVHIVSQRNTTLFSSKDSETDILCVKVVWADSLTKLLIFGQTKYKRILLLDSDSTLLKPMDELFFLPPQPAIMPRAYWLAWPFLSSHIMLLEPSMTEYRRVQQAIKNAVFGEYDMEIMNKLYGRRKDCVVMPHRQYALLSGEFRSKRHSQYMGKDKWDPSAVFEVSFSIFGIFIGMILTC